MLVMLSWPTSRRYYRIHSSSSSGSGGGGGGGGDGDAKLDCIQELLQDPLK